MTLTTESTPATDLLIAPAQLDAEILTEVTEASGSIRGTTIARRSPHNIVDVLVALARLSTEGHIERVAPGVYRAVASPTGP